MIELRLAYRLGLYPFLTNTPSFDARRCINRHGGNMGTRPEGDAMGEVQRVVHVQPGLPLAKDEDDCLSSRHDFMHVF